MILAETNFDIGKNLKKIRFKMGMSQIEMADFLNISINKYKFIELGITPIKALDLINYASRCGINPVNLMFKDFKF